MKFVISLVYANLRTDLIFFSPMRTFCERLKNGKKPLNWIILIINKKHFALSGVSGGRPERGVWNKFYVRACFKYSTFGPIFIPLSYNRLNSMCTREEKSETGHRKLLLNFLICIFYEFPPTITFVSLRAFHRHIYFLRNLCLFLTINLSFLHFSFSQNWISCFDLLLWCFD